MELFTISSITHEKIFEIFGKNPDAVDQDVQIIKKWLGSQLHLPEIMEETKIKNFLLLNKFSIERTKQKIDIYYSIRNMVSNYFEASNPKSKAMRHYMEVNYCCLHPKLIDEIYRVFFLKVKIPNQLMAAETGLQCANINEIRLYEDLMVGDIMIVDMINITLEDIKKLTPSVIAKLIGTYQKVFSLRIKKVFVINSKSYAILLLNLVKPFVKSKIFNRIQICSGIDILKEVFSTEDLPLDYGGNGPSLDQLNDLISRKLHEYQDRFDKLDILKVDESLRPEKLDNNEILGFYGNFKSLNVD